jgi:hypothetical protein
VIAPRGGCTNRCEYCLAVERQVKMQMLIEDALSGSAPTLLMVLTTRTATLDMATFYEGRRLVVRAIRRRWPEAEYSIELEYTTGYGPRAGGQRRPHLNYLWKNIPAKCSDLAGEIAARVWCRHVDALPEHQYCEPIRTAAAALKYLTSHFTKASQRAPEGFKGHRSLSSRGYFAQGIPAARKQAKESLAARRIRAGAIEQGHQAHDVEMIVHQMMRVAAAEVWVLCNERGVRLGDVADDPARRVLEGMARVGAASLAARAPAVVGLGRLAHEDQHAGATGAPSNASGQAKARSGTRERQSNRSGRSPTLLL